MAQGEDLQLKGGTSPKRGAEEGEKGGENGSETQTTVERQLPVYQSDPDLRDAQSRFHCFWYFACLLIGNATISGSTFARGKT